MDRNQKQLWIVAAIVAIPVLGYGLMESLFHALPLSEGSLGVYAAVTVAVMALGLAIPYWMFKLGFKKAHLRNPKEKEVYLTDIGKDKAEISRLKEREA